MMNQNVQHITVPIKVKDKILSIVYRASLGSVPSENEIENKLIKPKTIDSVIENKLIRPEPIVKESSIYVIPFVLHKKVRIRLETDFSREGNLQKSKSKNPKGNEKNRKNYKPPITRNILLKNKDFNCRGQCVTFESFNIIFPQVSKIDKNNKIENRIIIEYELLDELKAAIELIDKIALDERKKIPPTHFLCFPMNNKSFQKSVTGFQELIVKSLNENDDNNDFELIDLCQHPTRMHFTLLMLTLLDESEIKGANDLLNECSVQVNKLLGGMKSEEGLNIHLRGIDIFGSKKKARVLYLKLDEKDDTTQTLQRIGEYIISRFNDSSFTSGNNNNSGLKLHLTLLNSTFGAAKNRKNKKKGKRPTIDCSKLPMEILDYSLGKHLIKSIHISQRFNFDEPDMFYHCAGSINLNPSN